MTPTRLFPHCPYCWHVLNLLTAYATCPRCGYRETLAGVELATPRHCTTCTCQPDPVVVPPPPIPPVSPPARAPALIPTHAEATT